MSSQSPDKAARAAKLVARRIGKAPGGSLSDAINSFSQQRNAQLSRPGAGDVNTQLAMYQQPRQLMVADEPQRRSQQPMSQGVGDLGAEIDKGAKWLSGTPDDETPAPAKGTPQNKSIGKNTSSLQTVSKSSDGDPISTVVAGIQHLETGGLKDPYHYVSPAGAMGAYGVMPGTLSAWTKGTKYEGISSQDYLANPQIQDDVARIGATNYYNQYNGDVSKVGQAWLGGPGSVGKSNKDPWTGISTDQYGSNLANIVNSQHPQPQAQVAPPQPAAPPPVQPQASTNGPQAQADPMSNLYNKVALGPQVAAGYDNPQALFDPTNAKRGGRMRKRFDDGGSSGDGGDGGDGGDSAGDSAATAAGTAAGFGGVGDASGAPAGTSTSVGAGVATGFGGVGDTGFGGASPTGSSVGVNAPGVANANAGFGGQGVAANSAPGGAGGVGTGGVSGQGGGTAGGGSGGPGGTGGGGGTAAGGSGVSAVEDMYLSQHPYSTFGSGLGFGLGSNGVGNNAAANSNTALQDSLAQTQMRYGFVNGNDPGLSSSKTGQAALGTAPPGLSAAQTAQINALMQQFDATPQGQALAAANAAANAHGGATQGFGNAGFGGGSPSATVGGFGGNSNSTGAEGVNTASLNSNSLAPPGTPVAALQNAQIQADMQQYAASNGGNSSGPPGSVSNVGAPAVHASAPAPAPAPAAQAVAPHAVAVGQERSARGGYLRRASGGAASVAHIPTNELIQYALDRIRQRRNAANGGTQSVPTGSWEIGNASDNHNANTLSGGTYLYPSTDLSSSAPTATPLGSGSQPIRPLSQVGQWAIMGVSDRRGLIVARHLGAFLLPCPMGKRRTRLIQVVLNITIL